MSSTIYFQKKKWNFAKHMTVTRIPKEISRGGLALPRCVSIYDVDIEIEFLKYLPLWNKKWLILKMVTLLALL